MRRQLKASVRVWPPRESEGSGLDVPLVPPQSGGYEFVLLGACHASFSVDGVALIHRFEGGSETVHKSVELEAGRPMSFEWN